MKKYTGTIILAIIGFIFSIDAVLSLGHGDTISEFVYNFLHNDPLIGFTILIGAFGSLMFHFWYFRPREK